jgi:hypothetical protein
MTPISARTAARLAAVAAAVGFAVVPSAAYAIDPVPLPTTGTPVDALLAPSPSPSPSPSATPRATDPVVSQLPSPLASPVQQLVDTLTQAAPSAAPAPAPAPAPAAAPGTRVSSSSGTSAHQVAAPAAPAPGTGVATFPGLRAGTFNSAYGASGLAPMAAGFRDATLNRLLGVPNVAAPITIVPQAAPTQQSPSRPLPGGLPVLIVVVAALTVGGAAAGHLGLLRARRQGAAA